MLISKKHKFIFIHIPKTAGQSITHALSPFAKGKIRGKIYNILANKGPVPKELLNKLHIYNSHISAKKLKSTIGEREFKKYFSFTIVRNPWDWITSVYNYTLKNPRHSEHNIIKSLGSFKKYIKYLDKQKNIYLQKNLVCNKKGKKIVDYIGKYENLEKDFEKICSKIGISAELPKLNIYKSKNYKEYYDKETIDMVRKLLYPDIKKFNYRFGEE